MIPLEKVSITQCESDETKVNTIPAVAMVDERFGILGRSDKAIECTCLLNHKSFTKGK